MRPDLRKSTGRRFRGSSAAHPIARQGRDNEDDAGLDHCRQVHGTANEPLFRASGPAVKANAGRQPRPATGPRIGEAVAVNPAKKHLTVLASFKCKNPVPTLWFFSSPKHPNFLALLDHTTPSCRVPPSKMASEKAEVIASADTKEVGELGSDDVELQGRGSDSSPPGEVSNGEVFEVRLPNRDET